MELMSGAKEIRIYMPKKSTCQIKNNELYFTLMGKDIIITIEDVKNVSKFLTFGEMLKVMIRIKVGNTEDLYNKTGIDRGHLSKLSRGVIRPSNDTRNKLLEALGIDLFTNEVYDLFEAKNKIRD